MLGPVPAPAGLDTRTGGHSDRWAAGSQQPAASSPGLLSARPALPSPPGWLRVWSRWNQRALPSFVCWCFLPFTARFLFFWFIRPWGKPGPVRLPAEHPGKPPTGSTTDGSVSGAGSSAIQPSPPPPDPSSARLADSPSPSMGEATQGPWLPKPPFQRLEDSGVCRIHQGPPPYLRREETEAQEREVPGGPGSQLRAPTSIQRPAFSF